MTIGVCIAALVIWLWPTKDYPWSKYIDPSCTLLFSILVVSSCNKTLGGCLYILMEGAPSSLNQEEIKNSIEAIGEGVTVDSMNVWSLSRGKNVLNAKIKCKGQLMPITKKAM